MIPRSLRTWFVIHFAVDLLFAIPLLVAPRFTLSLFGWQVIEPITARAVGAALLAIGTESLLGRDAGEDVYRAMLNLKIIWSAGAMAALILGIVDGGPAGVWLLLAIFALFFAVWVTYRRRLTGTDHGHRSPPGGA